MVCGVGRNTRAVRSVVGRSAVRCSFGIVSWVTRMHWSLVGMHEQKQENKLNTTLTHEMVIGWDA